MKDKLIKIFETYKWEHQLDKLQEELDEFKEAVREYENAKYYDEQFYARKHIVEEYTDCQVVLEQFALNFDINSAETLPIRKSKVERQIKRIKKGVEKD